MPMPLECFAVMAPGLEALTAGELRDLELTPTGTEPGGIGFLAAREGVYRANLHLRTASRVLVRVGTFHASAFHELERRARRLPWEQFVTPGSAVEFRVTSKKSRLYHQDAIAERLLGVVQGRIGGVGGPAGGRAGGEAGATSGEGDEDAGADDAQRFVVRLLHDGCTVSADSSGALLHRRGYRLASAKAPLRETLAAAMLLAAGYDGTAPLLDPMCGAGTIPIEAALLARRIAPGMSRRFAFEGWPGFDRTRWDELLASARERCLSRAPAPIQGSDRDAGAIEAALANAARAGVVDDVAFSRSTISAMEPAPGPGLLIANPPYGARVGERERLRNLYAQFGNVARRRCPGWRVSLLSAHAGLERQTGLPLETAFTTLNGGIRVRAMQGRIVSTARSGR